MCILKAHNLKKYYGDENNLTRALDGVDLKIRTKEFMAIMGTSGSGKTTLLHMLGGLDKPTDGEVIVNGHQLSQMTDEQLTIFRRNNIGFIFQSFNLLPILNVYENIVLPIELGNNKPDKSFIDEIIITLGLDKKCHFMPNELSGGQQQRVAIARALATKPSIILADEPTGNLDSKTSQDVLDTIKMTSEKFGQTIIMITHNESIAQLADRIIYIQDGRIKERDDV